MKGWRPVVLQSENPGPALPLPLLGRMAEKDVYDSTTIGAANPTTGHLLWKQTRSEFTGRRMLASTVGNNIAAYVGPENGQTGPALIDDPEFRQAVVVLDPLTGHIVSRRMPIPQRQYIGESNVSDGANIIAVRLKTVTGYDISSGQRVWQVTIGGDSPRTTVAGHRIFGGPDDGNVGVIGN